MNSGVPKNAPNLVDLNPLKVTPSGHQREAFLKYFEYKEPVGQQMASYTAVNAAGKLFAETILKNTPQGADQTAAIRKVLDAKLTANAAIASNPEYYT